MEARIFFKPGNVIETNPMAEIFKLVKPQLSKLLRLAEVVAGVGHC
jgi:hypothetical protein